MKHPWFRYALLLAFVWTSVGCGAFKPEASNKRARTAGRAPQTGTNIPRFFPRVTTTRPEKAKTAKPERKRPAKRDVDEDFVTRGGFR